MNSFAKEVSIVVISHNRTFFLNILINSLANLNFGGHLIITDSSDKLNFNKTKTIVSSINKFQISHISVPKEKGETISQSMNACFVEGIKRINTKYSMLTCDDDIPVPETLEKFEKFLNANPSFNGVCGDYLRYLPKNKKSIELSRSNLINNLLAKTWHLKSRIKESLIGHLIIRNSGILKNSVQERLDEFIDSFFHTMFVLVRSETHKKIIPENYRELKFPHFVADYNWMFSIAIAGRIKKIYKPQIIRIFHGKNLSIRNEKHPFPHLTDAILEDYWSSDSREFIKNIANLVSFYGDLGIKESLIIAKKTYLKIVFKRIYSDSKIQDLNIQDLKSLNKLTFNKFERFINNIIYRFIIFRRCRIYTKAKKEIIKLYKI